MYMSTPAPLQKGDEAVAIVSGAGGITHSSSQKSIPDGHVIEPGTTSPVCVSTQDATVPAPQLGTGMSHCIQQSTCAAGGA
jgi:hypothetical protein